jgi:hypothetical protein
MECQGLCLGSPCKDSWFEVDWWIIKIINALGVGVHLALGVHPWRCSYAYRVYILRGAKLFNGKLRDHSCARWLFSTKSADIAEVDQVRRFEGDFRTAHSVMLCSG